MLFAVIAFTFFVPMVLKAKSKGYRPAPIVIPTMLVTAAGFFLGPVGILVPPALALLVVILLPEKEGAPGRAYLRHIFQCPECGQSVSFKRGREGLVDLCPKCGELITVPVDEGEAREIEVRDEPMRPTVSDGADLVAVRNYQARPYAELALGTLETAGITGILQSDDGGAVMPNLSVEYRLLVASTDLDKADRVLGEAEAERE
jgi:hypothetical protein